MNNFEDTRVTELERIFELLRKIADLPEMENYVELKEEILDVLAGE
jgi:hypothetical protein